MSFGARLRNLRQAAGFTQEELALRASLSPNAVSALERGTRRRPQPHTVRSLAEALGLSEDERSALIAAVPKRGEATSTVIEGSLASPAVSALPRPATPLVGRERELEEVAVLLGQGDSRLLTLTGIGGVGKTRLATEVVLEAAEDFPDGAAMVDLAPLGDPALVLQTIVRTLGLRGGEGQTPGQILRAYLREKELLLALDNFEHLLDAAPEVAGLIEACPDLLVLATSRAPLRVRGEREYPVPPLALPTSTRSSTEDDVLESPSGRLFLERARAVSPGFEITEGNVGAVAAICWRLAGLPLALELAAAKVRLLDPVSLLSRLDEALSSSWARDLPERQRTMRAALDWSHELLSKPQRELLRRLSVFAGGFTLSAAEAVGAADRGADGEEVLELLGGLVEQSLVQAKPTPKGNGVRYGMLEPVRQYALKKLEDSEIAEQARCRHAAFFLDLAERAEPELRGPRQVEWLDRLETEQYNMRSAVSWSLSNREAELAARLAFALARFFWIRGPHVEVFRWMEAALAEDEAGGVMPAGARARARYVAGVMDFRLGGHEILQSVSEEAAAIEDEGDVRGAADALMMSGLAFMRAGDEERALTLLEEGRRRFEAIGDEHGLAMTTVHLGATWLNRGDLARADECFRRGLAFARASGDAMSMFTAHYHLALAAQGKAQYGQACRHYAAFMKISETTRDKPNVGYALLGLAECWSAREKPEHAARLLGAAEALFESMGMQFHFYNMSASFHERHLDLIREMLDPEAFEKAWAEGRAMTLDEALAEALGERK